MITQTTEYYAAIKKNEIEVNQMPLGCPCGITQ